jgi:uncharacterized protein with WD repeat
VYVGGCTEGSGSVQIYVAETAALLRELQLPGIVELNFSPRGTYISTWERPGAYRAPSPAARPPTACAQ